MIRSFAMTMEGSRRIMTAARLSARRWIVMVCVALIVMAGGAHALEHAEEVRSAATAVELAATDSGADTDSSSKAAIAGEHCHLCVLAFELHAEPMQPPEGFVRVGLTATAALHQYGFWFDPPPPKPQI